MERGRRKRRRLAALLVVVVVVPTAAVSLLGVRGARFERERVRLRLAAAAASALDGFASAVRQRVATDVRDLDGLLASLPEGPEELRAVARTHRLVRQVFLLGPDGSLRYPLEGASPSSAREREFLERTRAVWEQGLVGGARGDDPETGEAASGGRWRSWTWGAGVSFLYWRPDEGGARGVEVEGTALLAEAIAALPETPLDVDQGTRVLVAGADGAVLYQWGGYEPRDGEAPLATRRLDPPLGSWALSYFAPAVPAPGGLASVSGVAGIGALVLLLALSAVWVWRESERDAREARRRAGFVNQVSHELKTPLTNIRLYAELMERHLAEGSGGTPPDRERLARQLGIIVDESRRLSRLVHNVLSFARRDRGALSVNRTAAAVDEVVRSVMADFGPALAQRGVAVELDLGAPEIVLVDPDALEQILANLVGNAEKYAADGKYLGVRTRRDGETTTVTVRDRGPGIPPAQAGRVFEAFVRLSDAVTDGAAGTGIGLTIARELARLHGGDLTVGAPEGGGAELTARLHTPPLGGNA